MAGFSDLGDAGASQDADQVAIVRGAATLRQGIGRILSGIAGRIGNNELAAATARADSAEHQAEWRARLAAAGLPGVTIAASSTAIPTSARGNTYVHTGSLNITYTLPAASGGGAVPNGWEVVVSNQGAGDLTIDGHGSDTIDGEATLVITDNGRSVRLQKLSNTVWAVIADTKDETGAAANPPTVVNVAANTAIPDTAFGDTYRVTGNTARTITLPDPEDVAIGWFVRVANGSPAGVSHSVAREGAGQSIEGGNGPLAVRSGESITIQKVATNEWELIADTSQGAAATGGALSLSTALTDAQKKAWRAHFGSWHLDVTDDSTLPAIANYNGPDGILLGQSGDTTVAFADISDRRTMLTAGVAGDLMLLLGRGWVRVGNLFTGGSAVAAVRALAEAAQLAADTVIEIGPPLIHDETTARNLNVSIRHPLNAYPDANQLLITVAGQPLARIEYTPNTLQQDVSAEVSTLALKNIWNQIDRIDDGSGGTTQVQRYPVGSYVRVEIRLDGPPPTGSQRVTHFNRSMDLLVIDPAAVPKTRFERTVGASPAVLPVGTYELAVVGKPGNNARTNYVSQRILLSDIPAADRRYFFRSDGGDEFALVVRYAPSSRTLTYSATDFQPNGNQAVSLTSIKAVGEA